MEKALSLVLSVLLVLGVLPLVALPARAAIVDSGTCGAEDSGSNLTWTLDDAGTLTVSGTGTMENYYYGSSYHNYYTTAPWGRSVYNAQRVNAVVIQSGVTSIGDDAFSYCTRLTSVTIPDSVTSIGVLAFSDCTGLTSVTIPDSVTRIGNGAFSGCTGLTSVTIPDSVTDIGFFAFNNCVGLTSVTIPDSVTDIGFFAFNNCVGLTSVTIPDSVTSIPGEGAFRGCTGLTSVTIPDSVTSIGYSAFEGCAGLTSVTIPDSVTSIWPFAFYGCTGLKDVYYSGSKTQWEAIYIDGTNDALENATIHYQLCSHSPGAAVKENVVEPTCTQNGSYVSVVYCELCGAELSRETVSVDATGHNYGAWTKLDDAQHQRVCANDPSHVETENHAWDDGVITTPATCTTDGVKTYTCTICNATKTETIPATGHSYGAWVKLDDAQHQRVCANDPSHVETENHAWDDGRVTTEPTDKAEGVKTYTCTVCGAERTEAIRIIGDADGDGKVTSADARLALRASVRLKEKDDVTEGSAGYLACDVDHDGEVTPTDARLILRASVGLEKLK